MADADANQTAEDDKKWIERADKIQAYLEPRLKTCPICETEDFILLNTLKMLSPKGEAPSVEIIDHDGTSLGRLPVVQVGCRNCGYLYNFAMPLLLRCVGENPDE